MSLENNLTLRILKHAEENGYGINAQSCYDAQSVIAVIRAAEKAQSPAIVQLFPVTLAYFGGPFLRFCVDACHASSVPIAVHLDHATDPEHLELAIGLAEKEGICFDSIMVDASHAETDEENIAIAKPYIDRCTKMGIASEVELGRLEGGEAGLRMISDAKLTDPEKADAFVKGTGATILAPSIGNLHGSYINPPNFKQSILQDLQARYKGKRPHICLHGTDELPDDLFRECIKNGVTKINVNSWARDPYAAKVADGFANKKPFPDVVEESTEVFVQVCERFFKLFGSAGQAWQK